MNIYVGNLPGDTRGRDLEKLFEPFGKVVSAAVARDKKSGVSRGFGFVEMATRHEGEAAIAALNEAELSGNKLKVNEAREREGHTGPGAGHAGHGADRFDQQARSPFRGGRGAGGRGSQTNRRQGGKRGV